MNRLSVRFKFSHPMWDKWTLTPLAACLRWSAEFERRVRGWDAPRIIINGGDGEDTLLDLDDVLQVSEMEHRLAAQTAMLKLHLPDNQYWPPAEVLPAIPRSHRKIVAVNDEIYGILRGIPEWCERHGYEYRKWSDIDVGWLGADWVIGTAHHYMFPLGVYGTPCAIIDVAPVAPVWQFPAVARYNINVEDPEKEFMQVAAAIIPGMETHFLERYQLRGSESDARVL